MATLTVWKFNDPAGAERAAGVLEGLQRQELIKIDDAATVAWPPERKRPKTRQLHDLAGPARSRVPSGASCSACCSSFHCSAWRSARRWAR